MPKDFVVTATPSMKGYAARVVEHLTKFPQFTPRAETIDGIDMLEMVRFADGEIEAVVNESIRGKDMVVFSSSARNEAGIGSAEAKIELYHTIDALKRSQAGKIIVFEPFVGSSRSDRTVRRSSVGLWVHFKTLVSLGAEHIVTYQLHSDKSKSMLDPVYCEIDDIPALSLIQKYFCDVYIRDIETLEKTVRPNWAFCSVDAGGEKLARGFANAFGAPLVVAHKQRDYLKANVIESINILSAEPLKGKVLWIIDDMVDTGGSVTSLVRALATHEPAEINIAVVHALFSNPAARVLKELMAEKLLNRIVVCDTVYCPGAQTYTSEAPSTPEEPLIPHLEVVPSAELSARIIDNIISYKSMASVLQPFNAKDYLTEPGLFNQ
jgi:ribose-phosphate pyrophosphokinase